MTTIELEIDDLYARMLEELDSGDADAYEDVARLVEQMIHESYQQSRSQ